MREPDSVRDDQIRRCIAPQRGRQASANAAFTVTVRLAEALGRDLETTANELANALSVAVLKRLRRRGVVIAVSGGIDSACVAALAVRALGANRILALLLPERDSNPESLLLGKAVCEDLGIAYVVKEISPILDAAGCYEARTEAVREVFPEFEPGMPWKIVLASDPLRSESLHFFQTRLAANHRGEVAVVSRKGSHDVVHVLKLADGDEQATFECPGLVSLGSPA